MAINWNFLIFLVVIGLALALPVYNYCKRRNKYKHQKFRVYLTALFLLSAGLLGIVNFHPKFLLGYCALFFVSFAFVHVVRKILLIKKGQLTEYNFFCFMVVFAIILVAYISAFSLFYYHTVPMQGGYFVEHESLKVLERWDSIYYSAFTFFSMEYRSTIDAYRLMLLITLFEILVSEIVVIGFIGILASQLLHKLRLRE